MNIQELLDILFPPSEVRQLTPDQTRIVNHQNGPAWVLAGPGSGKTEVLTVLVLRLLYVENDPIQEIRVPPESILVTTFTKKAARNLEDRISQYRAKVVAAHPELLDVDISKLRVETLHGLCNDLLQEFRAPDYQNVRLMDEFEQELFVHEHMSLIKQTSETERITFWREFPWMFQPRDWQPTHSYAPNRWNSTHALVALLNRLAENRVSIAGLSGAGGQLSILADLYNEYVSLLNHNYRCDFSQLQARFLDFLHTPLGQSFRDGDGTAIKPGIQWILVDEYQDTNPIQEEIYFELAKRSPHNLVIVGDDDQAMYRFRGGSVECMVTFDRACDVFLSIPGSGVARYPLIDNFRSHPNIVAFFNQYIAAFSVMLESGSRVDKSPIRAQKKITQRYPAVGRLSAPRLEDLARSFAQTVRELVENGVVNDPSECCLLLKSTRESPNNAGKYVDALINEGLSVYNPRNKAFCDQEEIQGILGALLAILDPNRRCAIDPKNGRVILAMEPEIRSVFNQLADANLELRQYVGDATVAIRSNPGKGLDSSLQELAYYIVSLEPFNSWQQDPVRRIRLGKITQLLEAFSSMPVLDQATGQSRKGISRGYMRASIEFPGEVDEKWMNSFYQLFLGYILNAGFDDEENEDVIVPSGMVPVMTMHQSKGLEFPFVFVGHVGENAKIQASHELETIFSRFPSNPARAFPHAPASNRAEMDLIRQYYVAYSRAKYALVLLGTRNQFAKKSVPLGPERNWVRHRIQDL